MIPTARAFEGVKGIGPLFARFFEELAAATICSQVTIYRYGRNASRNTVHVRWGVEPSAALEYSVQETEVGTARARFIQ